MAQRGWEYDLTKCIGCHSCAVACKMENNTYLPGPQDKAAAVNYRMVVFRESGEYPTPKRDFVSMACFHCADPACAKACPEGAVVKGADGTVQIDQAKCVGCRRCEWACPYGAPQFNGTTGKMEKCHFCAHRTKVGLEPACVQACVGRALKHVADVSTGGSPPDGFVNTKMTNPSVKFT